MPIDTSSFVTPVAKLVGSETGTPHCLARSVAADRS
jgi:hypothetical protein